MWSIFHGSPRKPIQGSRPQTKPTSVFDNRGVGRGRDKLPSRYQVGGTRAPHPFEDIIQGVLRSKRGAQKDVAAAVIAGAGRGVVVA